MHEILQQKCGQSGFDIPEPFYIDSCESLESYPCGKG